MRREEKVLKKLIVVYIQKGLTIEYTTQTLNLFNSNSLSNVGLTLFFFFLRKFSILLILIKYVSYIYIYIYTPFHKLFDLLHGLMTNNNYVFLLKD